MLAHLTRISSTKAGSAGSGAKINERDPGKSCLRLKVGNFCQSHTGQKGPSWEEHLQRPERQTRGPGPRAPEGRRVGGSPTDPEGGWVLWGWAAPKTQNIA